MIGLEHYIILAAILFALGALGVALRRNVLIVMMCLELMLNAVNLLLVAFSRYNNNIDGQLMVFFIIVIAACEAAVGLALVISIFRHFKTLNHSELMELKG